MKRSTPDELNSMARDCQAFREAGMSQQKIAEELGIPRTKVQRLMQRTVGEEKEADVTLPDFPEPDRPVEELLDMREEDFTRRRNSYKAHTWFPIKINNDRPMGILWFGDPHIDDDGCNIPVLRKYVEICKETEGLYGANIGDTTNNWVGRLMKKYADQETSITTARRMAEWFLLDSGVTWMLMLLGNHDEWNEGSYILKEMAKKHKTQRILMHDWEARFRLVFKNGFEARINAAHDFPGHSQYNSVHGMKKEALWGAPADLFVCGHRHNWAMYQEEMVDKGISPWFVRTRGFKFDDDYARRIGKHEQAEGCGIMTIFNPQAETQAGRVTCHADPEEGADYLTYLRKKY